MKQWSWVEAAGFYHIYEEGDAPVKDRHIATFSDMSAIQVVDRHNNEVLAARAEIARVQAQNHGGVSYVGGA